MAGGSKTSAAQHRLDVRSTVIDHIGTRHALYREDDGLRLVGLTARRIMFSGPSIAWPISLICRTGEPLR